MNLLFISLPFSERIVQALCWTLVHSLWQGLLLAFATGLVILLTRRSGPVLRYGLFSALFFLFFLGSCLTFLGQWDRAGGSVTSGIVIRTEDRVLAGTTVEKGINDVTVLPVYGNWVDRVVNYFNAHAFFIVALWLVLFSFRLMRITAQLGAQQRLRHYRVHSPSAYWRDRLGELARRLNIKVRVRLLESEIVKVPMVAGFIKPVILLPISILSQLSPSQVEAVLLHELAHIRRKDYIVNLLFSLGEMFYFFNPGVLWICALVREERENCCDDIAVGQAGSKKEFISALVSFQDQDRKAGRYALAFPGSGEHLLQRVRRIIYRDNKTLDSREKFFLICCFLISGALMLAFTHVAPRDSRWRPHHSPRPAFVLPGKSDTTGRDTLPDANDRVERYPDGKERVSDTAEPMQPFQPAQPMQTSRPKTTKKEKVRTVNRESKDTLFDDGDGRLEEMDKEIQKAQIKQRIEIIKEKKKLEQEYKEEEKEAKKEVKKEVEKEQIILDKEEQKRKMEQEARQDQQERNANRQREAGRQERDTDRQDRVDQEERIKVEEDRIKQEEKRIARESHRIEDEARHIEEQKERIAEQKLVMEDQEFRKAATKMKMRMEANDVGALSDPEPAPVKPAKPYGAVMDTDPRIKMMLTPTAPRRPMQVVANRKLLTPIINELMQEHRIDDKESFSFFLDNNALIVNGVRQPEELFLHFHEKFIHDQKDKIFYSRKKGGYESTEININSTHL
jgi:bla regulator protein blaR1